LALGREIAALSGLGQELASKRSGNRVANAANVHYGRIVAVVELFRSVNASTLSEVTRRDTPQVSTVPTTKSLSIEFHMAFFEAATRDENGA
jgi:hypothetical protein